MSDAETLKNEVKKLSARAVAMKMKLHDLSEELPHGWESVVSVAEETREAYRLLAEKRAALAAAEA